jgi:hypothetical protein
LIIVPKNVAVFPTCTDRLVGNIDAASATSEVVSATKAALTATVFPIVVAWLKVIVQGRIPAHPPPLQPTNVEPAAAVATNVIGVPVGKLALHVAPQYTPAGVLVMVPAPLPEWVNATSAAVGAGANIAVTDASAVNVITQVSTPEHPPSLHPWKTEPLAAVAVNVT